VTRAALGAAAPWRRKRLAADLDARFADARFPFRHDRLLPTLVVRATAGEHGLDSSFRADAPWSNDSKRALVERGYTLTDRALEHASAEAFNAIGLRQREESHGERL
jgi:hypothetical protein